MKKHEIDNSFGIKKSASLATCRILCFFSGAYETRTRDLLRDRQAF